MTTKNSILIAEDHALLRAGMRSLLMSELDLEVVGEASTGEEAVQLASQLRPDIVLMDLNMPGRGGLFAISEIRRLVPQAKVLVITMHKNDEYIQESLRSGAAGYILKDSSHTEMVTAIRTVVAGKTYLSPDVSARVVSSMLSGGGMNGASNTPMVSLTSREREVLKLVAEGHGNKQIAHQLHLSVKTVEKHRSGVMRKLGLRNVAGLAAYAISNGIISL